MSSMKETRDSFRMDPITLGGLIGAVVAFVVVGAIVDVLWVLLGAVVGGLAGYVVRRFARDARQFKDAVALSEDSSKTDLYAEAQELDIPGRSAMSRDELAAAIAERRAS